MSDAQKQKMRMHYKELFLDYDPRENLSELLQDGINRDPQLPDIKKSSRIDMKDVQIGQTTNKITFISKSRHAVEEPATVLHSQFAYQGRGYLQGVGKCQFRICPVVRSRKRFMALEKSYGTDGHGALQLSKPHEAARLPVRAARNSVAEYCQ